MKHASYRTETYADGGAFISVLSGKHYPFQKDRDGASKSRAMIQLRSEDSAWIDAFEQRAGRPISRSELITGIRAEPEQKPYEQKPLTPKDFNAAADYARQRLATAATPQERRAAQRMLENMETAGAEYAEKKQAEAEREAFMSRPEMQAAQKVADRMVGALEARSDIDQSLVDQAIRARQSLLESGDVDQFMRSSEAVQQKLDAKFEEQRAALQDKAKQHFAQARETMAESTSIE